MTDFAQQRKNMVESQVRPSDVTDRRIMRIMSDIPREQYLPSSLRSVAYMDDHITLAGTPGRGPVRQLLAPRAFAKMLQLLDIGSGEIVLDVGSSCGYSAAVLSRLAETVVALEVDADLASQAQKALTEQSIDNVIFKTGALPEGAKAEAPFDAILVNGSIPEAPLGLLEQLKDGGRLVAILASGRRSQATVWRRVGKNFEGRPVFDAAAATLPGFELKAEFAW
jgi:protein-L-isoaspartate(D-aspartate) O-methyltransferase